MRLQAAVARLIGGLLWKTAGAAERSESVLTDEEQGNRSSRIDLASRDHSGMRRTEMKLKLLHENDGLRKFAVILDTGDEIMACLQRIAAEESLSAAQVSALGAFSEAELAFFDWETKEYLPIPVTEQNEVASLTGDIARDKEGKPSLHLHAVLGKRDGTTVSGHLVSGMVRPTLEVLVTESPAHLRRLKDDETGLALIRLS
jgi:uncharacterized protein